MIFYGASGHAKVVIEAWIASGGTVCAVWDDNKLVKEILDFKVQSEYRSDTHADKELLVSIGDNEARKNVSEKVKHTFGTVIHPSAIVSPSVKIKEGTVIMAGAVVNSSVRLGRHVIINTAASVDHDCVVADYVHVSPGAVICGGVKIGEGAHIGAGATIIQNRTIGKWAIVGAGAVIVSDVPDFAVVTGVPGKIVRMNSKSVSNGS